MLFIHLFKYSVLEMFWHLKHSCCVKGVYKFKEEFRVLFEDIKISTI